MSRKRWLYFGDWIIQYFNSDRLFYLFIYLCCWFAHVKETRNISLVCRYWHHSHPWCIIEWKLTISFNYPWLMDLAREDWKHKQLKHLISAVIGVEIWANVVGWVFFCFFFPSPPFFLFPPSSFPFFGTWSLTPNSRESTGHSTDALKGPVEVLCCYRNHS